MKTNLISTGDSGYRELKSFQVARLVYDVTLRFCNRYIEKNSLPHDHMVHSARSCVENITEGFRASADSKTTELKLTRDARTDMEKLRLDYEEFLRQHNLPVWPNNDRRRKTLRYRKFSTVDEVALWVLQEQKRQSNRQAAPSPVVPQIDATPSIPASMPEITANAAITFTIIACSLLDRQIAVLAKPPGLSHSE